MTTQNIHKDIRNFFTAGPSTNANNKATKEKCQNVINLELFKYLFVITSFEKLIRK